MRREFTVISGLSMAISFAAAVVLSLHISQLPGQTNWGLPPFTLWALEVAIFGTAIAQALSAGFVPIRKPKKLPFSKHSVEYGLEYGTDTLEIHTDAITRGQRVLMVDDLLATGGTMKACLDLINQLGGNIVGTTVLIELTFLNGRELLKPYDGVHAVIKV